jgi:hypothetical protein
MTTSDSLYTDEVRAFLLSTKWPKGLVINTVEYDTHIALRLYRDNFETFDGVDKLKISQLLGETINALRNQGCPCYLEVAKGNGKQ